MMDADPDTAVAINRAVADFHGCPRDQALPCLMALRHVVSAQLHKGAADPAATPNPITPIIRTADAATAQAEPDGMQTGSLIAIHDGQPLHNGRGARTWMTILMLSTIS